MALCAFRNFVVDFVGLGWQLFCERVPNSCNINIRFFYHLFRIAAVIQGNVYGHVLRIRQAIDPDVRQIGS